MEEFTVDKINELIGVKESYQAPTKLNNILYNPDKRNKLFKKFLEINHNVTCDWFSDYFMEVQREKTKRKQDFTPAELATIVNKLVDNTNHQYFEPGAGTGSLLVDRWNHDRLKESPFTYSPFNYLYEVEELSDACIPFLLFNILIRGMNAIVIHGDSLSREIKQVYFCQNDKNDFMQFSSLNVMPHSDTIEHEFSISKWIDSPINHTESIKYPDYLKSAIKE